MDGEVTPPHNLEWFLTQVYESTASHGGRPDALDSAYLMTRYSSEFTMTAIPGPVRRIVFPIQAFVGRLVAPLPPLRERPDPGPPPAERYTPAPQHDQRP